MLEASAAQRPQQQRLVEALFGGQLCRVLGVGVVLDVGQDDGVAPSCAGQGAVSKSPTMMSGRQWSGAQLR